MCKNAFKGRRNTERTLAVPTVKLHVLYLHLWTVSIMPCQFIINICCSQRTQCQMQTAKVGFNCGTTSTENYFPVRGRKFQNMLYRMIHLEVMHGIIYLGFRSYLKSRGMESAGEKTPGSHACVNRHLSDLPLNLHLHLTP